MLKTILIFFSIVSLTFAQEEEQFKIPHNVQDAIDSGLEFLAGKQTAKGDFEANQGRDFPQHREMCYSALAGMAFLSEGSKPKSGKYAINIRKCIDYILRHQQVDGLLAPSTSHDKLYQHGFVLLFLCEAYGEGHRDAEMKIAIGKAVKLLVNGQSAKGGWRYEIPCADEDCSITAAQMMALRAAKHAGFHIPAATIEKAKKYMISLQNPDGSFKYTSDHSWDTGPTRTACALSALYSVGVYDGKIIEKAQKHFWSYRPSDKTDSILTYYFYTYYYAAFTAKQQGKEKFADWYEQASKQIVKKMSRGHWENDINSIFDTAMACIVLQVPNECLPIFQD